MRFNFFARNSAPTRNHEGAAAYPLTPPLALYAAVATAALSDSTGRAGDTSAVPYCPVRF